LVARKKSKRVAKPVAKPKKPAKSALDGLLIGLADAAKLIGKSETHVLSLCSEGFLQKTGRGQYRPQDVAQAALKFRESEDRRSSQTEERRKLEAARARSEELKIAREENAVVEMDEVEAIFSDILGTYRSELSGIPAASTRDLSFRAEIEKHLNAAIDRCRSRFEEAAGALRAGREVSLDTEEADAA
jgi:Phage DNA packaging protein Nu1